MQKLLLILLFNLIVIIITAILFERTGSLWSFVFLGMLMLYEEANRQIRKGNDDRSI